MSYTDKQLLDFLQKKNDEATYDGKCIFRMSSTGRGWRLHETKKEGASRSVRVAISKAIDDEKTDPE